MKKLVALLLCGMLTVSALAGCGEKPSEPEGALTETEKETDADEKQDNAQSEANEAEGEETAAADEASKAIEDRKAKAQESGEYQKIIVVF